MSENLKGHFLTHTVCVGYVVCVCLCDVCVCVCSVLFVSAAL